VYLNFILFVFERNLLKHKILFLEFDDDDPRLFLKSRKVHSSDGGSSSNTFLIISVTNFCHNINLVLINIKYNGLT